MSSPAKQLPIRSMTGFSRVSGRISDGLTWTLSIKGVNHRFLDLHMRVPAGAETIEMALRKRIKEKVVRGHVEITLSVERSSGTYAGFDQELLRSYIASFRQAAEQNELNAQPDLNSLFRLPGVLTGETRSSESEMRLLEESVALQIDAALDAFNAMRAAEGRTLVIALGANLNRLESCAMEVAEFRHDVQKAYFERISQCLAGFTNGAVDRDRILQEAAMLAERSDVEEEITRLRTHIEHFRSLLQNGGELGKKLDFLLQEMNREANTLLSKTQGVCGGGQRITELGLEMKLAIEKAREQVQNLE